MGVSTTPEYSALYNDNDNDTTIPSEFMFIRHAVCQNRSSWGPPALTDDLIKLRKLDNVSKGNQREIIRPYILDLVGS